jgi:hypothetical protein
VRRFLTIAIICLPLWPAGPAGAQALARKDLPLLATDTGDPRTRRQLTLGKAALESATTSGERDAYQAAVRHFEEAALHAPDLAEPWFGLALSRLALYENGSHALFSPTQPLGMPNRAAWASHLRAALARDPRHVGALTSIGHVLVRQGERDQPDWIRAALVRAESLGVVTPDLILVRGRLARQEKRFGEAAAAFKEFVARGGDPSIGALEEARAIAGEGDLGQGAARYDDGLSRLTPAGLELYRADLALVTEGADLDALRALELGSAAAWIRNFWLRRDAEDVRYEGDRLREHLRRWIIANERYRVVDPDRRTLFHEPWAPITPCVPKDSFSLVQAGAREAVDPLDPRRNERILDDRGLMYMRHGEPLRVVWTMGGADRDARTAEEIARNELRRSEMSADWVDAEISLRSQARTFEDRGLNFAEVWTFLIEGKVRSYMFRGSSYLGYNAPTTLTSDISSPELALLRAQLDPRFMTVWSRYQNPFPPKVPIACMVTIQRLAKEVRQDLMLGGSTDAHPLLFPVSVMPSVQVAAVGHPADGTEQVVVAYALPAWRMAVTRVDSGFVYHTQWRLTAVDAAGTIRRSEGELPFFRRDSLGEGRFLSGTLTLPVPAGTWQVGLAFWQPDDLHGGTIQARGIRLDGGAVTLSDLILGRQDDAVRWNGIPMNPLGTWKRGSILEVHTELRGVSAAEVQTTFEVRQIDRTTGRPAVRVATATAITGMITTIDRSLALGRLAPGVYRLTMTVEAPDGLRLTRERVFEVID